MAKITKKTVRKADVGSMTQTHGALQPQRSVADMIGYTTEYGTDQLEVYAKQIRGLSDEDLRKHAVRFSVIPGVNLSRDRLVERLEKHFLDTRAKRSFFQPQVYFPPAR